MAEIRNYHVNGANECAYCVAQSWLVHRYNVVASGTNAEMRALWPQHEVTMRVRNTDGIKHGGTSLQLDEEPVSPPFDPRAAFLAERYRYGSASSEEKLEHLKSLNSLTVDQKREMFSLTMMLEG